MKRFAWIAFLFLGAWDPVNKKQTDVAEGNAQMAAGKPAEAEAHYKKALGELPSNPGVLYDLGAAHYAAAQVMPAGPDRQKLLETAAQELRLAGDAPETGLRASAHYNLGNTLFAEDKFKDAIEEYKKALRLEPQREDARHNLELALSKLPPPQQQPQQQQQGSQDDQKKPQSGQSPQPSPSSSDDKKDPQESKDQGQADKQQQEKDQQKSQAAKPKEDPQSGQEAKGQEPKPSDQKDAPRDKQSAAGADQAGDKDMDRKLDLLEDRSKDLQVQRAQERARERHRTGPVKDW